MELIKLLKRFKYQVRLKILLLCAKFKIRVLVPLKIWDKSILQKPLIVEWEGRIQDVIDCPDNSLIKRVPHAGEIAGGKQIMHNGIEITLGGYYGAEIAQMLYRNKGVHEPQEEYAFDLILKDIPENPTMVELGCYWSFYSIWFLKKVKNGRCYLVEPDMVNLQYGINNFRLNNLNGDFTNAFVGSRSFIDSYGNRTISVNDYLKSKEIEFVDILHSDIQGYEYEMLLTVKEFLLEYKIGYLFISTHGNKIHNQCKNLLVELNYVILCDADENETFSYDGLIVAKSPKYKGPDKIAISKKVYHNQVQEDR